jgi:hypothetical protein
LFFKTFTQLPKAPRWGIYTMDTTSEAFTVLASKDGQVIQHTGVNLTHQVEGTLQDMALAWPRRRRRSLFKPPVLWAAWVLPDAQLTCFEWPCSPIWGPQDIEAECRLEAIARMQIPIADMALDYIVQRTPEGQLTVKVWHCPQVKVNALASQAKELGLTLQVITAHSQKADVAKFLGLSKEAMPC